MGNITSDKKPAEALTQKAYIAASNYIKKNILSLPLDMKNLDKLEIAPAKPVIEQGESGDSIGLTGVPISYDYNIAIKESKKRSSDMNFQWLEIGVPKDEMFLDLAKPLSEQPEYVQGQILGQTALELLFPDEVEEKLTQAYKIAEKEDHDNCLATVNLNMQTYYDIKRKALIKLGRGIDYICYLNYQSRTRDPDQTSAYLYKIGIKGIKYTDTLGDRLFMLSAHNDIAVSQIFESKVIQDKEPAPTAA